MSALPADECCGTESTEGDRSLQSQRGPYSQAIKQTKKKKKSHSGGVRAQCAPAHTPMKGNPAVGMAIFGMRVMQMTQQSLKDEGYTQKKKKKSSK